jgi:prepilin-type N-terminal cleavage/methylation domain-containing protein/prepilin-type processing-associated H-X9-DG protein
MPALGLARATSTPQRAFTLVELLVVIGIIAVLISILLPTLGRVRDQANTSKCLANLKQIGTALVMYVGDNKGSLPFAEYDGAWKPWAAEFYGTATPSQPYHYNNVHRHLMKYLNGRIKPGQNDVTLSSTIYRCPSAQPFPVAAGQPFELSNTSYTFNGVMVKRKSTSIRRSSSFIVASESRYAWNVSALRPYPTSTNIAADAIETMEYRQWMWVESGVTGGVNNNLLNFSVHRKDSAGNVVYLDGHATSLDYREVRPKDFGLGNGLASSGRTGTPGVSTDDYKVISADASRRYSADLR